VLDIGCGNGYHCLRMVGAGAAQVWGIDPSLLFHQQFLALKQLTGPVPAWHLPLGIESLPSGSRAFDTVLSMGVLYHRKDPVGHLEALRGLSRAGGEVVVETLVVEGDGTACLVPEGRYAQMRNVWFIPTPALLKRLMLRSGLRNVRVVDCTPTTVEEQRSTGWMTFHSLPDFLDPKDPTRTIEGYPAPTRATLIAEAP
jgi:tRNA (mo5U34)-methyltransferase